MTEPTNDDAAPHVHEVWWLAPPGTRGLVEYYLDPVTGTLGPNIGQDTVNLIRREQFAVERRLRWSLEDGRDPSMHELVAKRAREMAEKRAVPAAGRNAALTKSSRADDRPPALHRSPAADRPTRL